MSSRKHHIDVPHKISIYSKCALNFIIKPFFLHQSKHFSTTRPSVRHAVRHCGCCSWREKIFPPLHCDNFLPGATDLTCLLLLESPLLFASDSSPLEGWGAPLKDTGSWMSQSISVCQAIDCDLVRGAGDGGVPFWWAIGGNPLTPSTWQAEAALWWGVRGSWWG